MKIESIDLDYSVRENVIEVLGDYPGEPEMNQYESAFLTGLIRHYKPKKVVEIGVASGYTSSLILKQLDINDRDFKMYSVDLNKQFYRDKNLKTGFFIEKIFEDLSLDPQQHSLLTGDYAVNFIKNIGKDIDFLILDTVHSLPGEIFDFLAYLPYLSEDAIVVLHDVNLHHLYPAKNLPSNAISNCVLLSSVVADKLSPILDSEKFDFSTNDLRSKSKLSTISNIAAFKVSSDTHKYIDNLFLTLMLNWSYLPSNIEFDLYFNHLSKHYSKYSIELFEIAYNTNKMNFALRKTKKLDYNPLTLIGIYLLPVIIYRYFVIVIKSIVSNGMSHTLELIFKKVFKHA